ncbi:MAG: hypothetical protein LC803_12055 [Acidobacteria bacterium]|nr:hypothetical protein [Acidobacteriota bacterium]
MINPLERETPLRWRWGLLAALALMLISLFPQAHLCYKRGSDWHGSFAHFYSDEPAYSAYVNALIDGRPRRNDPYTGHDHRPDAPLAESLFSIQFVPAYMLSIPARALGLSASTMFILLMPFIAGASALAIFWLLSMLTRDERLAAAGVPFVLCLGVLVCGQGLVVNLLGRQAAYVFLPFLRRYVPGVPFVFFFFFCGFVWRALAPAAARRARLLSALAAGVLFALMVYSYFYHWTTAAALLASLALLWLALRPAGWRRVIAPFMLISLCAVVSLVPYFILLARRAPTMDTVQALTYSRVPDLWRGVILFDALVLVALAFGVRKRWLDRRDPAVIFNAALALCVLVVFNQQIITGRSLQPMHYEQYIGNYVALLAGALAAGLLWHGRNTFRVAGDASAEAARATTATRLLPHRVWLPVALGALVWGAGETVVQTRRIAGTNLVKDEWAQVALRLKERARAEQADPHPVVFNSSVYRVDNLPTYAPLAAVWAPHMFVFSSVSVAENKERFFKYLYYSGIAAHDFETIYRQQGFIFYAIFGWDRANPRLTVNYRPITQAEIDAEKNNYANFHAAFDRAQAAAPLLSYVVAQAGSPFNFAPIDRWYERDAGERVGRDIIYRVRLRD